DQKCGLGVEPVFPKHDRAGHRSAVIIVTMANAISLCRNRLASGCMPRPFGGGAGEVNAGPGARVTPGRAGLAELPLIGISVNSAEGDSLLIITWSCCLRTPFRTLNQTTGVW